MSKTMFYNENKCCFMKISKKVTAKILLKLSENINSIAARIIIVIIEK